MGLLPTLIGGALSFLGQSSANKQNIASAREQMKFQERMSNTEYQRGMADMKKAGLNPMLAYQKGGASTPGGAMPNIKNPLADAPTSAANYTAAKVAKANVDNLNSATALNAAKAQTEATLQRKNDATTALDLARADTEGQMPDRIRAAAALDWEKLRSQEHITEQQRIGIETAVNEMAISGANLTIAQAQAAKANLSYWITHGGAGNMLAWLREAKEVGVSASDVIDLLSKRGGLFPKIKKGKK